MEGVEKTDRLSRGIKYMNHYSDRPDYTNIPHRRIEAARRIANVLHQLGSNHLFLSEEMVLNSDKELRDLVEDCCQSLREGRRWPPRPRYPKKIILDQPKWEYVEVIREHCKSYNFVHIDFLCSYIPRDSHFCIMIFEGHENLTLQSLDIPIEKWNEYKNLPEYKGD
jgi:hypothetical protein